MKASGGEGKGLYTREVGDTLLGAVTNPLVGQLVPGANKRNMVLVMRVNSNKKNHFTQKMELKGVYSIYISPISNSHKKT